MKYIDLILPFPMGDLRFSECVTALESWGIYPMMLILDFVFNKFTSRTDRTILINELSTHISSELHERHDCMTSYDRDTETIYATEPEDASAVVLIEGLIYGDSTEFFTSIVVTLADKFIEYYGNLYIPIDDDAISAYNENCSYDYSLGAIPEHVILRFTDADNINTLQSTFKRWKR